MSALVDCPGCQNGRHDQHVGPWNVRDGVLGGAVCCCQGDCSERVQVLLGRWQRALGRNWAQYAEMHGILEGHKTRLERGIKYDSMCDVDDCRQARITANYCSTHEQERSRASWRPSGSGEPQS